MTRVISIDPGAERLGWAIVEKSNNQINYVDSGIVKFSKPEKQTFQNYKIQVIKEYTQAIAQAGSILDQSVFPVDLIVNEIVPAVGSFGGVQMYIVNAVMSVIQSAAIAREIPVEQVAATSVRSCLMPGKKKATKVQIRNKVIEIFPELKERKADWKKEFDEPDAIAIGVAWIKLEGKDGHS